MIIQQGGKSHQMPVSQLQAIRIKILGSHLTCKVANKCLNIREQEEVGEINKDGPLASHVVL